MNQIESLKITTIAENIVQTSGLGQWGLSFLLELKDAEGTFRKIVFDTSANKRGFLHNARLLKIDFSDVDAIVLSHGHGDHTAATVEVVKKTGGVKVYGHPHTFLPRQYEDKNGKRKRAGQPKGETLSDIENAGGQIILSDNPVEIVPGLWTTGQVPRTTTFERISPPSDGGRRIIIVDGEERDDQILDDQSIFAYVKEMDPWVITGCAHSGPVNTLRHVKNVSGSKRIETLIGGTHLVGRTQDYLNNTIQELEKFNLSLISPCHCTGFKGTATLWQAFPEEFVLNYCLRVIESSKKVEERII
jgi:7,8-dihydropterin-6-yl-methyl-4-(beta-D-ribofuranosyl)aminobenzene 5'-phosphate synthase